MKTLRPQDIVVVLKLLKSGNKRPSYAQLANDLFMSPSEVHASIRRARAARLMHGPELGDRPNVQALEEFLIHGIRYAFPPERGGRTRGLPTAHAAEPLSRQLTQEDPAPVALRKGPNRGEAVASLAMEYLNLNFDDDAMTELPPALTSMKAGLLERLRSRQSTADGESSLPPGFDDTDEEPTVSSKDKPG